MSSVSQRKERRTEQSKMGRMEEKEEGRKKEGRKKGKEEKINTDSPAALEGCGQVGRKKSRRVQPHRCQAPERDK